ncbi:MAG TPA: S-methyl-5'-thioinosine phosphorylase [Rhodanobacteraceae bacterium]|jgi:5'-methylthioinosine phosphorylase|nr:S-methyl-5'-thioinosine phosphorylase [Rhodanobacteraceae bacterium]
MNSAAIDLAVIGGTGVYAFPGLQNAQPHRVSTRWGEPSSAIVTGEVEGRRVAFLARHGEGHTIAPHRINYRANIDALHELGARRVIGVNAVGGIRGDMGPRMLAIPDQLIDYTTGRASSFCDADGEAVLHAEFGEPYTASLRRALLDAARRAGVAVVDGGCYGATQGPRLETRAEIARMRRDGCDLVGMTGMPEAALARERGLDYACIAVVANWAAGCGPDPYVPISLDEIHAHLAAATGQVPAIVCALLAD